MKFACLRLGGRVAVALALLSSAGCSKASPTPAAGLMIIVSTSMSASEFNALRVEVSQEQGVGSGSWNKVEDETKPVPAKVQLPATVFVRSGHAADQDALIRVTAYLDSQPIVLRMVQTQVPVDRIAELRLLLAEACKGQVQGVGGESEPQPTCSTAGQSCQPASGTCGDSVIAVASLATYVAGDESLDGSATGSGSASGSASTATSTAASSSPSDSGVDATLDAGTDAAATAEAGADGAAVCTPSATRCVDTSHTEVCATSGQWSGSLTRCPSTTPFCAGTACGQPPSCQGPGAAMFTCGAGGNESCCTSLIVEGGTFDRTYDLAPDGGVMFPPDGGATGLADPASVSTFYLDKYDVTVGRFKQFVTAFNGGWAPDAGAGVHTYLNSGRGLANSASAGTYESGWNASDTSKIALNQVGTSSACSGYWTYSSTPATLPINCINWYEAYAFCIWDGGFLPSETEWRYAAAGGSQQRLYPWGSTDPGMSSQYAIHGDSTLTYCSYPTWNKCAASGTQNIAPVGSATAGAGLWGQLDLSGNVFEFTLDWFANSFVDPCTDCAYLTQPATGPDGVPDRTSGGGSFFVPNYILAVSSRAYGNPAARGYGAGVRCARSP